MQRLIERAKELLNSGEVKRVLGWKKGDMGYNHEPYFFNSAEELKMQINVDINTPNVI